MAASALVRRSFVVRCIGGLCAIFRLHAFTYVNVSRHSNVCLAPSEQFKRLANDVPGTCKDLVIIRIDRHGALLCLAGGSTIGLSATDAYGTVPRPVMRGACAPIHRSASLLFQAGGTTDPKVSIGSKLAVNTCGSCG